MSKVEDKLITRMKSLIDEGLEVYNSDGEIDDLMEMGLSTTVRQLDRSRFATWQSKCGSFLENVFGSKHTYTQSFKSKITTSVNRDCEVGVGILKAALDELENDFLGTIHDRISVEIFDDLIELSEPFLKGKKPVPAVAACIVGAVLEDSLRKILEKNNVKVLKTDNSISKLNQKAKKEGIYNQVQWRYVDGWGDIRNDAAHGHWENMKVDQVEAMVRDVRSFVDEYLS